MKTLFKVLTGTELIGFVDKVTFEKIECYLEPLDEIILDDVAMAGVASPEGMRFSTFGFYSALNKGYIGAVEALHAPEASFVDETTVEYEQLRETRNSYVTKAYFDKVVRTVEKISSGVQFDPNLQGDNKKVVMGNMITYKRLAIGILSSAGDVAAGQDITIPVYPDFNTMRDMDMYIDKKIQHIKSLKFPETVNRDMFFRIVRQDYMKLNKYI